MPLPDFAYRATPELVRRLGARRFRSARVFRVATTTFRLKRRLRRKRHFHPPRRHPFCDRLCQVDFKRRRHAIARDVFELGADRQPVSSPAAKETLEQIARSSQPRQ